MDLRNKYVQIVMQKSISYTRPLNTSYTNTYQDIQVLKRLENCKMRTRQFALVYLLFGNNLGVRVFFLKM